MALVAKDTLIGCEDGCWTIVVGCLPLGNRPASVLPRRTRPGDRGVVASDVIPAFNHELVPLVKAKAVQKTRGMGPVAGETHHFVTRSWAV